MQKKKTGHGLDGLVGAAFVQVIQQTMRIRDTPDQTTFVFLSGRVDGS